MNREQLKICIEKNINRSAINNSLLISSFISYIGASFLTNDTTNVFDIICNIILPINLVVIFMHAFYYIAEFFDIVKESTTVDPRRSAKIITRMENTWSHNISIAFSRLLIIPAAFYIISRMILFNAIWSYIVYSILSLILLFFYIIISATMTDIKRCRKQIMVGRLK